MNNELFDREWSVLVGPPGEAGKEWTNLRTTFKIEKSGSSTPNKAEVQIYNLSESSRNFLKKRQAFQISAGYKGNPSLLFSGAIEIFEHEQHDTDWVTKLENHDGLHAYRGVVLSESFKPGTTEATILDTIAKKMNLKTGDTKGLNVGANGKYQAFQKNVYNHGRSLSGPASKELDAICSRSQARWSIQNGVLQILCLGQSLDNVAVVVSADSGMLGSPKATETGVKFEMLLAGKLDPGCLVQIESKKFKGVYVVENLVHEGDSHGHVWKTTCEAIHPISF